HLGAARRARARSARAHWPRLGRARVAPPRRQDRRCAALSESLARAFPRQLPIYSSAAPPRRTLRVGTRRRADRSRRVERRALGGDAGPAVRRRPRLAGARSPHRAPLRRDARSSPRARAVASERRLAPVVANRDGAALVWARGRIARERARRRRVHGLPARLDAPAAAGFSE